MSDIPFPTLVSSNWKLTRTPQFKSIVQVAASGMRTSAGFRSTPLWKWTLKNGILQSAQTIADLQAIERLVNSLAGMYDSFLWTDPESISFGGGQVRVAMTSDAVSFERLSYRIWQCGELSFEQVKE